MDCSVKCRNCGSELTHVFVDLGKQPLANSYLDTKEQLESVYPLKAMVCGGCFLVQLEYTESPEVIFSDYAYFTSYSPSALDHARRYAGMAVERFGLNRGSLVVEVASNDGYLLQYFAERDIPVLGIEPAANVAAAAHQKCIPTQVKFFGTETAKELKEQADLLVANNVLAHVPNLHDFIDGLKLALKPDGVITVEFPHLLKLIENTQFDTIYHEHIFYFSFSVVEKLFEQHGLRLFDVEELSTHGGSLRVYACHSGDDRPSNYPALSHLRRQEQEAVLTTLEGYTGFTDKVEECKLALCGMLTNLKQKGKRIAGFGAPAKGNTLLNVCGIGSEVIDYTVDDNPHKQRKFLPGSRIPVYAPQMIRNTKPDYIVVLPWNLVDHVVKANSDSQSWGAHFIVPIPRAVIV